MACFQMSVLSLLISTQTIYAANILVISTVISHSHSIYTSVLTNGLATRGHKLVVLSPDREKKSNPNITSIYLQGGYELDALNLNLEELSAAVNSEGFVDNVMLFFNYALESCRRLLFSDGNKGFYREYVNYPFDLILVDTAGPECFLKYAAVFKNAPIVGYSAFISIHSYSIGDFDNPSYVPYILSTFNDRMNFLERLVNWFQTHSYILARRYWLFPKMDKMAEKFFGFYEPTVQKVEDKMEIFLANEHFSITHPKPRVPASIPVAGLHIKPPKPLPQDIEQFISESKHGVIFFSLGSNFLSKHMTNERKRMFLEAFGQLQQKVLWKYEDDSLQDIPQNVLIRKWFPQTDILGHNNTVLFITHNGFLSTQESIYFGVPMLGIPLLMDQFKNNMKIVSKGIGLRMDLTEIKNSQQIVDKIEAILSNPSFKQNVQKMSDFFRDRPSPPLDTAIFWIEYVLRHKGADQLRVASFDLHWYQYYLLDIYLTVVATIVFIYYTFTKLLCLIFKRNKKQKKL